MNDIELRPGIRADLAQWMTLHCQKAGTALAAYPSTLSAMLGHDPSGVLLIRRSEELAKVLEETAAKIRRDLARFEAFNVEDEKQQLFYDLVHGHQK